MKSVRAFFCPLHSSNLFKSNLRRQWPCLIVKAKAGFTCSTIGRKSNQTKSKEDPCSPHNPAPRPPIISDWFHQIHTKMRQKRKIEIHCKKKDKMIPWSQNSVAFGMHHYRFNATLKLQHSSLVSQHCDWSKEYLKCINNVKGVRKGLIWKGRRAEDQRSVFSI